jgi:prepilin-type N-terminal cleavage/methylation domain-containing protein
MQIKRRYTGLAFTLVELLVVIGIIGILASIGLGMMSLATKKSVLSSAQKQLKEIETGIENFRGDFNQNPPDNPANFGSSPLLYELKGTLLTNNNFYMDGTNNPVSSAAAAKAFNVPGFVNSSEEKGKAHDYLKGLNRNKVDFDPGWGVSYLVLPVPWDARKLVNPPYPAPPITNTPAINPWFYNTSSPSNNANGYDLWGYLPVGKDIHLINNWTR